AGTLADPGEDRVAARLFGDVVDKLLNDDGLADTSAAKRANLAATHERRDQVDHLDACDQHLGLGGLILDARGAAVDGQAWRACRGWHVIHGLAEHVEDTPKRPLANGHRNWAAGVVRLLAATQAIRRAHADAAYPVVSEQLLDLQCQRQVLAIH